MPLDNSENNCVSNLATIGPITEQLIIHQRLRIMHIRRYAQINLPIQAVIKNTVGYNTFLPKNERELKKAKFEMLWLRFNSEYKNMRLKQKIDSGVTIKGFKPKIRELFDLPENDDYKILEYLRPDVFDALSWLEIIEARKKEEEARIERLAAKLPAAGWVLTVPGLSLKALGIIQAEARGDIETFLTPYRLWSRLGWGSDGKVADVAVNKMRKAQIYSCAGEPVFKVQSARYEKDEKGKKTDVILKEAGPYRLLYDGVRDYYDKKNESGAYAEAAAHKLMTCPGGSENQKKTWKDGRLCNDHLMARAIRVMIKSGILLDLWLVSRGKEPQYGKKCI